MIEQEPGNDTKWQQKTMEKLLFTAFKEQRRSRRWKVFFRSITLLLLTGIFILLLPETDKWTGKAVPHTAKIELYGEIMPDSASNSDDIIKGITEAFEDVNTKGIILRINSPGGSAVQSGEIYDAILRLRKEHPSIPLYAVVEDACASGAYYVAAAADKIYANKASFIGSIGALIDGFSYTGLMEKLGVQRRLITAGENKGFMDPFSPMSVAQQERAKALVEGVRSQFIESVKATRGDKIKSEEVFSGFVWTGTEALQLGLIDDLSDINTVAEKIIGAKDIVDYTIQPGFFRRFNAQFNSFLKGALAHSETIGLLRE